MKKIFKIHRVVLVLCMLSSSLLFAKDNEPAKKTDIHESAVLFQTTPPAPTIYSQDCSSAQLENAGTIPSGEMWYWQGTVKKGTSTTHPATSMYTANGSGTYYIRPKNLSTGVWGTGAFVVVTLDPNAGYNWYLDSDGDGLGDPNHSIFQCLQPFGYVSNSDDLCPDVAGTSNDGGCEAEDPDNQNYIHTITARIPTTNIDTLKSTRNVVENITYFDGLGRPKQSVAISAGGGLVDKNALLYDWTLGNTGSTGFYNFYGDVSENQIVSGTTPFGHTDLLWECANIETVGGPDGGWNTDDIIIDNTQTYRYTVWVKKTGPINNGDTYHGPWAVDNLDGSANGNPYFWSGDLPQGDTWYLLVGVVHPHDHTGGDTGVSGVYDMQGVKVLDGVEFKWRSGESSTRFRSLLHSANDITVRQYFWSPLVQEIDGTELSLTEVLNASAVLTPEGSTADIVTHIEYDQYGRQLREYLPFATYSNDGKYRLGDMGLVTQTYYKNKHANDFTNSAIVDVNAYSEKFIESSPLARVLEQTAPGEDWKRGTGTITGKGYSDGHSIRFEYDTNTATEVRLYEVSLSFANNTYTPTLTGGSTFFPVGELIKSVTKDENWTASDGKNHTTEEFKNKSGQVILKRTYADIDFNKNGIIESGDEQRPHDTYYVYDDYGNLSYVLPPKIDTSDGVSATELSELSYQYKYDHRNRLVEKKIPGKGWEYIVYDTQDRPVLTQDAIQRATFNWLFTKYDKLGRVVYTGEWEDGDQFTRVDLQDTEIAGNAGYESRLGSVSNVDGVSIYYTNNDIPDSDIDIFTINYYDTYVDLPTGFTAPTLVYGQTVSTNTKGLATVSKVRVLGVSPQKWITTVTYYDEKARPIYVYSHNEYLETTDIVESSLDSFTGRLLETKTTHKKVGKTDVVTIDKFEYDHMDRLTVQTQKINNQTTDRLVKNQYDELGQLESKLTGNGAQKGYTDVTLGVSISGDLISKTTADAWDAGLATIGSFEHDGYLEFVVTQTNKYAMIGLSDVNDGTNFNTIDFAIYIWSLDRLRVYENGVNQGITVNYSLGDHLKVERIGHEIHYKINDETFYISSKVSNGTLLGDASFYSNGLEIRDLHLVDNSDGLQKVDYTYNVRGWLKTINNDTNNDNDLFNFTLLYNDIVHQDKKLFNGNISALYWNTANTDSSTKQYTYTYDALNRIRYGVSNDVVGSTSKYSLHSIFYDKNGNIENLYRNGHLTANPDPNNAAHWGLMDNLIYTYDSGNKLVRVTDYANDDFGFKDGTNTGDDFTYDVNGNMLTDENKGITNITYNHLNLPVSVGFSGQQAAISYVYDASGVKLSKTVAGSGLTTMTTEYAGNYIYENGDLQFFNHVEGYTKNDNGTFSNVFQYKDHLGNVRLSYADTDSNGTIDVATEIIEESHYYPFGLKHKGYNTVVNSNGNSVAQRWGFGGKELNEELGLEWMDFGARNYDASLGRWMNLDPLAENYISWSPYNYTKNNPIKFIDPDGRGVWIPDSEGNLIAEQGDNAETLATHLNISEAEADKMIVNQKLRETTDKESVLPTVVAGQKLEVNNNMTRSIKNSNGRSTDDQLAGDRSTPKDDNDNYGCHASCELAVKGKEINAKNGLIPAISLDDVGPAYDTKSKKDYKNSTTEVKASEAKFGKTVITISNVHSAMYYGKSKNGTVYVYSKNGHDVKPEVSKLSKVQKIYNKNGKYKVKYHNYNGN